jgi:hypothetical protein
MSQGNLIGNGDFCPASNARVVGLPCISVEYMYRDANNFKCYEIVNFSNHQKIDVSEIWRQLNEALEDVMLFSEQPIFRPEWVGLPTVFLFQQSGYLRGSEDHDWHEVVSIEETDQPPTFNDNLDIKDFIDALRRTHSHPVWVNKRK